MAGADGSHVVTTASHSDTGRPFRIEPADLSPSQAAAVCASLDGMTDWLLHGGPQARFGLLRPTTLNWRVHTTADGDHHVANWTVPQFAGFWWYLVCWARQHVATPPQPITLPNIGRLIGVLKGPRDRMTAGQLHHRMVAICQHWALIVALAGRAGLSLEFNETTLANGIVNNCIDATMGHGDDWVRHQHKRLEAGLPVNDDDGVD